MSSSSPARRSTALPRVCVTAFLCPSSNRRSRLSGRPKPLSRCRRSRRRVEPFAALQPNRVLGWRHRSQPASRTKMVEPGIAAPSDAQLLIRGGRVYDHDGDIDDPPVRDILIRGSRIVSVTAPDEDSELKQEIVSRAAISDEARVIEARGKLVIPGFVNSHYHSYDVLAKGLLEDMPFDVWALHSQPAYFGPRSRAELRIRTLLGALECIRNGITTLQDMNSLVPQDEETLDVILSAYAEIGIRVVFSIAVRDVGALDIAPFLPPDVSEAAMAIVRGASKDAREEITFVERQIKRLTPLPPRLTWGLDRKSTRLNSSHSSISYAVFCLKK